MEDKELIQRLALGEQMAFREIVEKYQTLVFNVCFHILQQRVEAEDITQDVFIEAFESIHRFRHESKLSTWLYRISINKSLNQLRKQRKKSMLTSLDGNISNPDNTKQIEIEDKSIENSPQSIEYKERNRILQAALNSLPENQRIAFSLCKFDELSYVEISSIMALSISSVESLIHRAKKNLQKKLISYYKNT